MDLCNKRTIQRLLRQHDIRPRKHLGQNFLISRSALNKIVAAARIQPNDTVLEIGGGVGTLTIELAKRAEHVIVYERDPQLCGVLRETLAQYPNAELRCADARRINTSSLPPIPYTLVANLPYSVGTVILRQLLENERPPKESVIMLQREVAERIAAKPPHMSLLAIAIQSIVQPERLFRVAPGSFWPKPEVESAVIHLQTEEGLTLLSKEKRRDTFEVARKGFAKKRKRVLANISRSQEEQTILSKRCAIPSNARAQELSLKQWNCLADG